MRKRVKVKCKCRNCGKMFDTFAFSNRQYCSRSCRNEGIQRKRYSDIKATDTICWTCANANDRCSWFSKAAKPVEGWKAERKDYKSSNGTITDTYVVHECPNYIKER